MGHEVVQFSKDVNWHFMQYKDFETSQEARAKFLAYKSELQSALIEEITSEHRRKEIDLFFSYFWSDVCEPATIDYIKSLGIKTLNWYCNGSYQFELVAKLAPHYDWSLVPEKFRIKDYLSVGANPIYCQEAANPAVYKPYDVPFDFDVTFVGQAYGERPAYIRYLLEQGIDVKVWGYAWDHYAVAEPPIQVRMSKPSPARRAAYIGRRLMTADGWRTVRRRLGKSPDNGGDVAPSEAAFPVTVPPGIVGGILSDIEVIRMFSRSKINLGFSTCGDTHLSDKRIVQVRLRDFEVPMSGGFYMTEYMEELEEFFDIGKEIVCYADRRDLAQKIKYYLSHDREREQIRRAGHERCLRDHTWEKRFEKVFEEIGLSKCVASPAS
jgi:spore maturation protein CgeB